MQQRRLAAIMFTDILGYTSLLQEDERKAFDQLRKSQRIYKRLFKKFNGRRLKEMGGGILASFHSNIDAVMCALSIQKAAEEVDIPIRIGIHQGDVIFEKKDVLGDGVNIASRIQGVAKEKDIVISERVYHDLKNKEGLEIESLGEQSLKGVKNPIGIYKITSQDESLLDYSIDTGELVRPLILRRESIVVGILVIALLAYAIYYFLPKTESATEFQTGVLIRPFDNYTSDTLEYYTAGMHDALITDMGKISAFKVISKTTARAYKDVDKTIPEIAAELGINAIIDGEVLCLGDSVCLQIKLQNTDEEEPLWIKEFYVDKSQILNLYNSIAMEISAKINVALKPQEELSLAESRTVDPDAYEAYLKGQFHLGRLPAVGEMEKAMESFQKAIDIDPNWAPPYFGMTGCWHVLGMVHAVPWARAMPTMYKYKNKALELDPNSAMAHANKAGGAWMFDWDWETDKSEHVKTFELNPGDAVSRVFYAHLLMILQEFDEALYQAKLAIETDPMNPFALGLYGVVLDCMGDHQAALEIAEKALSIDSNANFARGVYERSLIIMGDHKSWYEGWKKNSLFLWEEYGITELIDSIFHEQGYFAVVHEMIRINEELFAKDGRMSLLGQARRCLEVKKYDKAMDYFEKAYENHEYDLPYNIALAHIDHPEIKENPRYFALLKKMNLPLP